MESGKNYSPCEHGPKGTVNFFPRNDGAIERVEARTNSVVISYVEDTDDEGEKYLRRFVWVECKDQHLKDDLLVKAREIIAKINE